MRAIALLIGLLPITTTSRSQDFPQMVVVTGGTFLMGDEEGDADERPAHLVSVKTFYIATTETTVSQWQVFCRETHREMPEAPWFGLKPNHPIVNVSWDDAVAYCRWLKERTGKSYHLPTEAEWEFAAKGGSKGKKQLYSGSLTPDSVAWYGGKSNGTMPVATKSPNALGIFDLTGNVWEWCSDWYDATYYAKREKDNPHGPPSGRFHTLRGGAWDIGARNCRNTYRNPLSPSSRNHNKGFRVVYRE